MAQQVELVRGFLISAQAKAEAVTDAAQATVLAGQVDGYMDRLFELEDTLRNLTEGQVLHIAQQGEQARLSKLSGSLVLALGVVLGGLLGIMAAFFAEFASQVRQSLKEEEL